MYKQDSLVEGEEPIVAEKKTRPQIRDYITNRLLPSTPEEQVRQIIVQKLVEEYGYHPNQIQTVPEFHVTKGSNKIGPLILPYSEMKKKSKITCILS